MSAYLKSIDDVLKELDVSVDKGLTVSGVSLRVEKYGANVLKEPPKKSLLSQIWGQLNDPMILILAVVAIISGALGEVPDSVIIFLVIAINTLLGIVQENKADAAIGALKKMSVSMADVKRDGKVIAIPSTELVPGDIVLFEAGDNIPADIRLIEAASLRVEEAALTGESVPAEKSTETIVSEGEVALGDRVNMAYMGTSAVYGRGAGVVVGIGMNTEMGKIANALSEQNEERTPLQLKLADISKLLSVGILIICTVIFAIGFIRYGMDNLLESFMIAVSLAVAAIPEGLVVVVTVQLAVGVKNMAEQRAVIRRLTAVETLGCASVICSDKTGTLTQNKMTVVTHFGDTVKLRDVMFNCNDAEISGEGSVGDPTEIALKVFGGGAAAYERVGEAPFDSERKLMSTLHKLPDGSFIQYTKGAPDELLKRCTSVDVSDESDEIVPLTKEVYSLVRAENKNMADRALRVLGGAVRHYDTLPLDIAPEALERDLVFVGLCGMIDPVRPEVKDAIAECASAGIKTVMITGDHKDTALAIAKDLGIAEGESQALSGAELSQIPDSEFDVTKYSVYARVQPEHKMRIVNAWKAERMVTAMTGDGVNDAPALKAANIGVGMGITGTDVTKNVADMVLVDDNFATIVGAVKEGRRIYDNIRKAVLFLISTNLGEVAAVFLATLVGFVLLHPIHILWINLVTDTFPALALGMDSAAADVMKRPPRKETEGIFSGGAGVISLMQGVFIGLLTLASYWLGGGGGIGITMAFVTMSLSETFHALNIRAGMRSFFARRRQNALLWGAVGLSVALTFCVVYLPWVHVAFDLVPLGGVQLTISLGLSLAIVPVAELIKVCYWLTGRIK